MNNVQMLWSLCAECVEFLSQMRSGAVLMESTHFFTHGRMHLEHHSCCCCLLPRLLGLPQNNGDLCDRAISRLELNIHNKIAEISQ